MARGSARAPSHNAYRGSIGRTQTATVHVTSPQGDLVVGTIYTTIDAVSDPELVERLHSEDPARALNVLRIEGGQPIVIAAPVVYHDPAAEVMVLVLGEAHRHREIDERIKLYERLREDDATIPAYAKDFAVVFGPAGLRAYLEHRAQQALAAARSNDGAKDSERRRHEIEQARSELERSRHETGRARQEIEVARQEIERLRGEARSRMIASTTLPDATTIGPPPTRDDHVTAPVARTDMEEIATEIPHVAAAIPHVAAEIPHIVPARPRRQTATGFGVEVATRIDADPSASTAAAPTNGIAAAAAILQIDLDEEPTGTSIIPPGSDPLTTDTHELPGGKADPWLDFAATGADSSFEVDREGKVRLALLTTEQIARGLGGELDVRVLLHRVNTYAVITLVIGPPAALRVPSPSQLAVVPLDIGVDLDRQVVAGLAKQFALQVDVIVRGQPIRSVLLTAPLAENCAYVLRAADDHLRGIGSAGGIEPSFQRARDLISGPSYDLLGTSHAEAGEFRDDKLAQLKTAQSVRRAIAIARRFARPSREDYLVCARGFPLSRWHELRRHVLSSAVTWGIWMGPELAQVAVSEGLARSRRDLVVKLEAGFETLRANPEAFDIDDDAAADNLKALAEEAKALGVELRRRPSNGNGAIKSEDVPVVSGSIERTPTEGMSRQQSTEELLVLLDDKKHRILAASELCDRGDPRAAAQVIAAVKKMSRAEAVRILGKSVKFGPTAAAPLIEGLASSKAYLRHGCALALALLRTDEGTQAVIDLLLAEPTEIWREVARAIGQIGPTALIPLASRVGSFGSLVPPTVGERVSWAMAHVGVRGGKPALEQMAAGASAMTPVAAQALQLLEVAARDEVRVRPGPQATKDVTVNRAFSRRFFEALEANEPEVALAALHDLDASAPLETLDEADLIADEDDEAELDESDLIQT